MNLDGLNTCNYVTRSVTKLLISTYVVTGLMAKTWFWEILLFGNSPEGLLDFWENKQTNLLKMVVDKLFYSYSALSARLSSQIDRRHEVRACHELCELLKTENTLVPLHCFIVTKVWRLIFKNIFVFLNVLSIKSSNWYYLGLCCYRCVWFGFLYWWFLCRTSQLGFQELAFIWLTAFSWVKITEEVISDNKDFFV